MIEWMRAELFMLIYVCLGSDSPDLKRIWP